MFATSRKHQQWLFLLICGVVIISFVVFFSPDVGVGSGPSGPDNFGVIDGEPVTRAEFNQARDEEAIEYFLNWGEWPSSGSSRVPDFVRTNFTRNVLERMVALKKLKSLGIEVGDEAVVSRLRLMMRDPDGAYDPAIYQGFLTNGLRRVGLGKDDLFRFVRHEAAMEQLRETVAVGGQLVTRAAAEAAFRRENERRATEAVFFNVSNFLAQIKVETNAVRSYFTNRSSSYRTPAQAQVSYVRFATTNFLGAAEKRLAETVTNLTEEIDRIYSARGEDAFTGDDGKPLTADKAKEQIRREDFLEPLGLREARKAASDFANALYNAAQKMASDKPGSFLAETNFINVAKGQNLKVEVTEAFSRRDGLSGDDFPPSFASAAFQLGGTNLVRIDPIVGDSGVFLIALNKRISSQAKKFEEVEADVTEDYKRQEALNKMRTHVREMQQKITNSVAEGKTFKAAAEELKLTVVDVPPFSQTDRTNLEVSEHSISFPMYQGTAFRTEVGEVCYPQTTGEAGYVLHVKERVGADEAKVNDELDDYIDMLRSRRQSAAFQSWISREIQASGLALPAE